MLSCICPARSSRRAFNHLDLSTCSRAESLQLPTKSTPLRTCLTTRTRLSTSPDFIRLTPPIPLSNGAIFSTSSVKSKEWIVEVALRVHGSSRQGGSKGGRGFGFWYTKVRLESIAKIRKYLLANNKYLTISIVLHPSPAPPQKASSQLHKHIAITTAKSHSSVKA